MSENGNRIDTSALTFDQAIELHTGEPWGKFVKHVIQRHPQELVYFDRLTGEITGTEPIHSTFSQSTPHILDQFIFEEVPKLPDYIGVRPTRRGQ